MTRQKPMVLHAPAKINLYLDVLEKRPDGYHELISLMCCIGIHDTVRFSFENLPANDGITVVCDHPEVPSGPDNLAHRAAAAFFETTGLPPGLSIAIEKQIPVGAGLGGGSSDAAAVLTGLNRHFGSPLPENRLMTLGRRLGADVPFFISGRPAVARGIGEKLSPVVEIPDLPIVLIYPGRPVSTGTVYKKLNLALTKTKKIHTKFIFETGKYRDICKHLYNVLEPVAMELCPEIGAAKQALIAGGADGALMSGSGSSVFGIFQEARKAENACRKLSENSNWQVFHTRLRKSCRNEDRNSSAGN